MRRILLAAACAAMPLALSPAAADEPKAAEKAAQPGLFVAQGETWFFKIKDGQPVDARKGGRDDEAQPGEIKVSLRGGMMNVRNSSDKPYNYQAFISRNAGDKGQRTSVCTLIPGVSAMEMWPEELPGIRLTNFKDAGDGMICA